MFLDLLCWAVRCVSAKLKSSFGMAFISVHYPFFWSEVALSGSSLSHVFTYILYVVIVS